MRKIWFNGDILDETEAKISVYDSALMFGDMVFEMTRTFHKSHFKLAEHLNRLESSMRYAHIKSDIFDLTHIYDACVELSQINEEEFEEDDEHRLMINVTRGKLSIYNDVTGVPEGMNIMITDFPLRWTVNGFGKLYDEGINAVIVNQRVPRHIEPKIKHRSRIHFQLANIEASKMKGRNNWALLLDDNGNIAEGTGDNFFIVKNNMIFTPKGKNILRGISRQYIFELAMKHYIVCEEKDIDLYDVMNADEAFMTGTPFCILPVCRINDINIGDGSMGPMTKRLLYIWSELVDCDIMNQIKKWDYENKNTGVTPYEFR